MEKKWTVFGDIVNPKNTMVFAHGHVFHKDDAVRKYKKDFALQTPKQYKKNLSCPVNVTLQIIRKDYRKDAHNLQILVFDCLQDCGVIENDRQVVSWSCTARTVDRNQPRVIIEIEELI